MAQTTVVIQSLGNKKELPFCNSRRMDVVVLDKGQPITVHLSQTPLSALQDSTNFDWFWEKATKGMECHLIKHNNQNYLYPI